MQLVCVLVYERSDARSYVFMASMLRTYYGQGRPVRSDALVAPFESRCPSLSSSFVANLAPFIASFPRFGRSFRVRRRSADRSRDGPAPIRLRSPRRRGDSGTERTRGSSCHVHVVAGQKLRQMKHKELDKWSGEICFVVL